MEAIQKVQKVKVPFCLHFAFRTMAENCEFHYERIFVLEFAILGYYSYKTEYQDFMRLFINVITFTLLKHSF